MVRNLPARQDTWVRSLSQEDPLEPVMETHTVFLPGESHGQRGLWVAVHWDHTESDVIEAT